MTQEGYLLALSRDGTHWFFVDRAKLTPDSLRDAVPELAGEIELPPKKDPVLEADAP
jgi:hypothetical protein